MNKNIRLVSLVLKTEPSNRKHKLHSPINIGIAVKEKKRIKQIFFVLLNSIKDKTNSVNDWYDISFRCVWAYEIAKKYYEEQTCVEIKQNLDIITDKLKNKNTDPQWFIFTQEEIESFIAIDEANDEMVKHVTNKAYLELALQANVYMQSLINV